MNVLSLQQGAEHVMRCGGMLSAERVVWEVDKRLALTTLCDRFVAQHAPPAILQPFDEMLHRAKEPIWFMCSLAFEVFCPCQSRSLETIGSDQQLQL